MKKFIFSNVLWGVAMTLAVLFFYFSGTGIEPLELKFYDFRTQLNAQTSSKNEIAIIEINDDSISKIGRWPWPRSRMAEMLTWLSTDTARPSVIGLNILFSEPETNKDLEITGRLRLKYQELLAAKKIRETTKESEFDKILVETQKDMDNDAKLAAAISAAGNIVLPMYFKTDELVSKPRPEPDWLKKYAATVAKSGVSDPQVEGSDFTAPVDILAASAAGVGHVNIFNDSDGAVRKEYPLIPYNQNFYPSFAEELARTYLKLKPSDAMITPGSLLTLGGRKVPLDYSSSMLVAFNKSKTSFKYYSFYDVLNGKIVPEAFKDKIVLIGLTAQGVGSLYVTPVEKNLPAVEFSANVTENILHGHFIIKPDWAPQAELGLIVFIGLFITFLLPRLKAGLGAVLAAVILAALSGTGIYLFTDKGLWVKTAYPSFLLVAGYIFIVTRRFFSTEKKKELIEVSAIETNKMLGLSFQGQGMLDLSFEKFRNCPVDDTMKELLYNLALDFERKRQFNKAVAVYGHIAAKDPAYKDIQNKIEMLTKASDGAVFGGSIGKTNDSTMLVAGSSTIPTLGRYEITKKLGKGAVGIVYLGRDPKINRTVAIKTLRFEEGIQEAALKELKDRFFREAQAAGNLSHPNIVKIYDAGEEQDIAYMAMELLKGEDLKKWASKDNLLPMEKVFDYMATSAEALDYAHRNGVIHRDIKPANIMLLEDGALRVADFGIARIQTSSKTATGTVLGTPYYMSPEQIAGKKVDGRADLFSLGVTMYELLTGERPWKGGEAVGTLFFQISSDPYPDPLLIRPDLPKELAPIIDKALKKNPDERYQTGGEMASDIRRLLLNRTATPPDLPKPAPQPQKLGRRWTDGAREPAAPQPPVRPAAPSSAPPANAAKGPVPGAKTQAAQTPTPDPKASTSPAMAPKPAPPAQQSGAVQPLARPSSRPTALPPAAAIGKEPQPLKPSTPQPGPAAPPPAPPSQGLNKLQLEPPSAALSLSPQKAEAPQTLIKSDVQLPIAETLAQPPMNPAPGTMSGPDFEKTLPLIYPEGEKK
jgi:serine/threonine-protein kinase